MLDRTRICCTFSLILFLVMTGSVCGRSYRFVADVTGPIPPTVSNDVLWNWQQPGLFGVIVPDDGRAIPAADADEEGLAGAELHIRDMAGREIRRLTCDDYGWFKVSLPPGHYRLMARHRDHLPLTTTAWPCIVSPGRAGRLRIPLKPRSMASSAATEQAREEVALFEQNGPMCGLFLKVRTVGHDDVAPSPIGGAEVTVYDNEGNPLRTLESAQDGTVLFKLEPGNYGLDAEATGFAKAGAGSEGVHVPQGELTLHAITMLTDEDIAAGRTGYARRRSGASSPAAAGGAGSHAAGLSAGGRGVAGHVSLKDPVSDRQIGLDGVEVVVVSHRGKLRRKTVTSSDGTYTISLPKSGYYSLLVRKDGYTTAGEYVTAVKVHGNDLTNADVEMKSLDDCTPTELAQKAQLWKMYVSQERPAGIRGFLYERPRMGGRSQPVSGVEAVLCDGDGYELDAQYANERGEFFFAVEPGNYIIETRASDYRKVKWKLHVRPGQIPKRGIRLRRLR